MNKTDNFDLENKDHTLSNSRVSPDSAVSDDTRVSNDDEVENDQLALSGGDRKSAVFEYDSMFDDYMEKEKGRVTGTKQSFRHGYEIGDMVWGKVKSHPWWPGHIFDESFATTSVRRSKRKGFVLVAFFGDSSYGWFDHDELIPFEPHFAEKSKQISSKGFLKAVEEAADEASRRRGLGLACRCRNANNFKPAKVKGYFTVDLGDNAPSAVYSMSQITMSRDEFRAHDVIGFMRDLALKPKRDGRLNLEFLKEKASVLAYRKAVYEEFDDTYAQAFGQSPVQPSVEPREALMHSVKAPLSGPMVIAETLGKKTPTKSSKKDHTTNNDKYIFKRRDDPNALKSHEMGHSTSSTHQSYVETSTELADGDYVLQRRAPLVPPDQQTPGEQANDSMVMSPPSFGDRFSDPTRGGSLTKKGDLSKSETVIKKGNKLKRPAGGDLGPDSSISGEKKRKKKKDLGTKMSSHLMQKFGTLGEDLSGDKVSKKAIKIDVDLPKKDDREDDSLPKVELKLEDSLPKVELKLEDLLDNLHYLALDPYHGRERNSPTFTRQAFLKFRALVFQKSLGLSAPSEEANDKHDPKPGKSSDIVRSAIKVQSPSKKPKPLIRSDDQTKVGEKRGPSDRQEEKAAKRRKKVTKIKSLIVEKKTLGEGKDSVVARPQKPLKTESAKKIEAPRKTRERTVLVLKFPPQSTLPSENELKARLARFGPLDHSFLRVFWKTSTCRAVFFYKEDAEGAYRHLSHNNDMFGNIQMRCHTRPLETPAPAKVQRDENAGPPRALPTQSTAQIKSCLKKPLVGEAGPTPGGNGGSKGAARVKFVLGGGENSGADVGNIGSSSSASASNINTNSGVDLINKNSQLKVVVSQNPLSNSHSPQVVPQISKAPINFHLPQSTQPTNISNLNVNMYGVARAGPSSTNTDIAQEMLNLMSRCNDVVINLKGSLGYVPYFSL